MRVKSANPCTVQNPCTAFDSIVSPSHLQIYQSAVNEKQYSSSCDWECENTVFNLWLTESVDVKPADMNGQLYLLKKKNLHISGS